MENVVMVALARWAEFEALVAKASARAQKLGFGPVTYEASSPRFTTDADGVRYPVRDVRLCADESKVSDWVLMGRLDHLTGQEALVRGEVPASFRELGPVCQHCEATRRRKETYLVRNIHTKRRLLVGRSCMGDFLESDKATALMAHFELLACLQDAVESLAQAPAEGVAGVTAHFYEAAVVLGVTAEILAAHPWVSAKQAKESGLAQGLRATFDRVLERLNKAPASLALEDLSADAQAQVQAVLDWLGSEALAEQALASNYLHNLRAVARAGLVTRREVPLWASALRGYEQAMQDEARRRKEAETPPAPSVPVGRVGERITVTATVVGQRTLHGEWGITQVHRFIDEQGNDLVWFTSSADPLRQGARYQLSGRVLGHDVYRDRWQTKLSRVTVHDFKLLDLAQFGEPKKLKKLLEAGVDVNVRDGLGRTPLMLAVENSPEVVSLLLAAGADLRAKDDEGMGVIEYAQTRGASAVLALLEASEHASDAAALAPEAPLTDDAHRMCA